MKTNPNEIQRLTEILARLRAWQENPVYSISRITEVTGLSRARVRQLMADGKFAVERGNGAQSIILASVAKYFSTRLAKLSPPVSARRRSPVATGKK